LRLVDFLVIKLAENALDFGIDWKMVKEFLDVVEADPVNSFINQSPIFFRWDSWPKGNRLRFAQRNAGYCGFQFLSLSLAFRAKLKSKGRSGGGSSFRPRAAA
jgi:hypothetical protein